MHYVVVPVQTACKITNLEVNHPIANCANSEPIKSAITIVRLGRLIKYFCLLIIVSLKRHPRILVQSMVK